MVTMNFCGLCGKTVGGESMLKPLQYSEEILAQVCITCGSSITTSFKQQIAQTQIRIDKLYREMGSAEAEQAKDLNTEEVEASPTKSTE